MVMTMIGLLIAIGIGILALIYLFTKTSIPERLFEGIKAVQEGDTEKFEPYDNTSDEGGVVKVLDPEPPTTQKAASQPTVSMHVDPSVVQVYPVLNGELEPFDPSRPETMKPYLHAERVDGVKYYYKIPEI